MKDRNGNKMDESWKAAGCFFSLYRQNLHGVTLKRQSSSFYVINIHISRFAHHSFHTLYFPCFIFYVRYCIFVGLKNKNSVVQFRDLATTGRSAKQKREGSDPLYWLADCSLSNVLKNMVDLQVKHTGKPNPAKLDGGSMLAGLGDCFAMTSQSYRSP